MDHILNAIDTMLKECEVAKQSINNILSIIDEILEMEKAYEAEEDEAVHSNSASG